MSVQSGLPRVTLTAYLSDYRWRYAAVVGLAVAISIGELVPPLATRRLIDAGLIGGSLGTVAACAGLIAAVTLGIAALDLLQGWLNATAGEFVLRDLRRAVVAHLAALPLGFFVRTRRGDITNRIGGDVELVRRTVTRGILLAITNALDVVGVLVALLVLDWHLAVAAFASILIVGPPFVLTMRSMYPRAERVNTARDELTNFAQRVFSSTGIVVARVSGAEKHEARNADALATRMYDTRMALSNRTRLLTFWASLLLVVTPMLLWLVGGIEYVHGHTTIGTIVAATTYALTAFAAVSMLSGLGGNVVSGATAFSRLRESLALQPEDVGGENVEPSDGRSVPAIRGEGARFRYDDVAQPPIAFTGTIDVPGFYAVVGPSGVGKSSLVAALLKHIPVSEGTLALNGCDVRSASAVALRGTVALASQDAFLYNATILDNVRYGRPEATDLELREALDDACASEFTDTLAQGLDFVVGDRGSRLSGGQRQRIALARALLKNAPVLVLDEATSELDVDLETTVLSNVRRRYERRHLVVITHRLPSVMNADRIFVVEVDGSVACGKHEDLMSASAVYAQLFGRFVRSTRRLDENHVHHG